MTIEEGKLRYGLWASEETMQLAEDNYRLDGCKNRSAYIEKVIRFYTGYLHAQRASDFLPEVLSEILIGAFGIFGDCLSMAGAEGPEDIERISLALQGYNFGSGYISWALRNYGGYLQHY